jgi:FAD/FMN-containing dehydrogenase
MMRAGGISYLASQYGWGSDNIDSLEVVLANGTIVTANETKHSDLFRALRGGGPNFGIVTSFTLKAYPTSGFYGGFVFYSPDNLDRLLSLWVPFTKGLTQGTHPKGHIPISIAFADEGVKMATALVYPEPVGSHPPFEEFLRLADSQSNIGLTTQSALATALHEAVDYTGRRNSYWTLTTRIDEPIMRLTYDLWLDEAQKARQTAGIILDLELHPITSDQRQRAGKEGVGNAFGLEGSEEPLVIHLLAAAWDDSSYDQAVFQMQKRILDKVEAESKRRGIFHPFLYMNYASEFQDVIGSYGETSRRILEDVSKKYDPEGVFQELQPGPFKLSGAPASVASHI